MYFLFK